MKKINDWSAHIARHFWHCSSVCRKDETTTDEEALKTMKVLLFFVIYNVPVVAKMSNSLVIKLLKTRPPFPIYCTYY
jgi:hypothetical protein